VLDGVENKYGCRAVDKSLNKILKQPHLLAGKFSTAQSLATVRLLSAASTAFFNRDLTGLRLVRLLSTSTALTNRGLASLVRLLPTTVTAVFNRSLSAVAFNRCNRTLQPVVHFFFW